MSGLDAGLAEGSVSGRGGASAPARVLAVFERGNAGRAALGEAAELANAGRELTIATLAPQARPPRWGRAGGEGPYNIAIRQEAELELREAREILGSVADRATFTVIAGCPQPPLASWVSKHGFELVLLPHRRLVPGGNPFAKSVRRGSSAEVRVIR